jgi:WS/DGAT/MGAT family acyltransferase
MAVMIVSASLDSRQDDTAQLLTDRVRRCWPEAQIRWVDVAQEMGPGARAVTRVTNQRTPALLGRRPGRALAPVIERDVPDVILSSHPVGSAGLAWLRRRYSLPIPTSAWISDASHPPRLHPELDLTVVPDQATADRARSAQPNVSARIAVAAGRDESNHTDDARLLEELAASRPAPAAIRPVPRFGSRRRLGRAPAGWPLAASDSMFYHIDCGDITQQVGAIITVTPDAGTAGLTAQSVAARIESNLSLAPVLRRRLVSLGRFKEPGWVVADSMSISEHVTEAHACDHPDRDRILDRFWSEPLALDRPPWHLLVLHTPGSSDVTLVFKIHHALADAFSLIESVGRLLSTDHGERPRRSAASAAAGDGTRRPDTPRRKPAAHGLGNQPPVRIVRGLAGLARHAAAPRWPMNRRLTRQRRGVITLALPTAQIREVARNQHARSSEVSLALMAEALHRSGAGDVGGPLRAMMPVALGLGDRRHRAGNRTGAISVAFPIGPMPIADRIQAIKSDLRHRIAVGEPEAAEFVVRVLGAFPAPLHGWLTRRLYSSRFLNLLTGYVPGPLHEWSIGGNRLTEVFPVMALAAGVTLAVGMMRYADTTGLCLMFDESIRDRIQGLDAVIRQVLDDLAATAATEVV